MRFSTLSLETREKIARITLNRPEATNSINMDMAKDLMHAVAACSEDPAIRALIILGAGKVFCTGGDVKAFAAAGTDLPLVLKELTTYLHAAVSRLVRLGVPVVAAVQGAVAGAGMSLMLASDFAIAGESTRFTMAYTRVGLTPDGALTFHLSRLVGLRRAIELTMTNRVLTADEALAWHLVTEVVPDSDVLSRAELLVSQLAAGPTRAFAEAKRLFYSGWTEALETQMENETQAISRMAHTADAREGITAFIEKRAASFSGE